MYPPLTTQSSQDTQAIVNAAAELTAQTFRSVDEAIESVLRVASRLVRSRTLFIARFDTVEPVGRVLNVLTIHQREGGSSVPLGISGPVERTYCNTIWKTGAPLLVEDSRSDPFYSQLPVTEEQNIGSYVGVPLLYGNGQVYGTLCGLDPEPIEMRGHPEMVDLLQILARLLISYIERDELNRELEKQRNIANTLLQSEKQARADAEAASTMRRKLTAIIAHELREPLASIKTYSDNLLARCVPEQREDLAAIDAEAIRLTDLIEQVFDLTQIETGLFNVRPEVESLADVITEALPQLQSVSFGHRLDIDLPSDLSPVWADRLRVAQLLASLVGNAAKFSPIDTPIRLSAGVQGDEIQIDVADNGPGIPADVRDTVFEAFRQLETRQLHGIEGVGLGLSVCKGIVDAHGGRIWVAERSTPGTTIAFTLMTASA